MEEAAEEHENREQHARTLLHKQCWDLPKNIKKKENTLSWLKSSDNAPAEKDIINVLDIVPVHIHTPFCLNS